MAAKSRAEEWLFLGFVASLPFPSVLQFRVLSASVQLPDVLFLLAAAAWIIAWVRKRRTLVRSPLYFFMAVYAAAVVISALASVDTSRSLVKLIGKFYLIGVACLTLNSVTSLDELRRMLVGWVVGAGAALLLSLAGIGAFYLGFEDPSRNLVLHPIFGSLPPGHYARIEGLFFYPAMFCNYLGVTWMLTLLLVSAGWMRIQLFKPFAAVLFIVNAFTLTPGVGGIFLSSAGFLGSRWHEKARFLRSRAVMTFGVVVAAAFFFAASVALFRYDPEGTRIPLLDGGVAPSHRAYVWKSAFETFLENPLFGKGVGIPAAYHKFTDPSGGQQLLGDAHNTYLSLLGETGLIGFFAFAAIAAFLTLGLVRLRADDVAGRAIKLCLLLALCDSLFYQSLTGSYEDARHLWVLFGMIGAVIIPKSSPRA